MVPKVKNKKAHARKKKVNKKSRRARALVHRVWFISRKCVGTFHSVEINQRNQRINKINWKSLCVRFLCSQWLLFRVHFSCSLFLAFIASAKRNARRERSAQMHQKRQPGNCCVPPNYFYYYFLLSMNDLGDGGRCRFAFLHSKHIHRIGSDTISAVDECGKRRVDMRGWNLAKWLHY